MLVIGGAECWVIWITDLSCPERETTPATSLTASEFARVLRRCKDLFGSHQEQNWLRQYRAEPCVSKLTGSAYYGILANAIALSYFDLARMQSHYAASPSLVKGMTTDPSRPSHKHKNSLLTSPFEQVVIPVSPQRLDGESIALLSPTVQSSQGQCMRRMSGKALFAE